MSCTLMSYFLMLGALVMPYGNWLLTRKSLVWESSCIPCKALRSMHLIAIKIIVILCCWITHEKTYTILKKDAILIVYIYIYWCVFSVLTTFVMMKNEFGFFVVKVKPNLYKNNVYYGCKGTQTWLILGLRPANRKYKDYVYGRC